MKRLIKVRARNARVIHILTAEIPPESIRRKYP